MESFLVEISFSVLQSFVQEHPPEILQVFKIMGLLGYNKVTYYYHQRHFLFPSIVKYWQSYQKKILDSLKEKEVVIAGDGRQDSMGHSAKYCSYTVLLHNWTHHSPGSHSGCYKIKLKYLLQVHTI